MDVEEIKKIIESKIEAEATTKIVRSKIKSYIHEKQNLREGFKETFKPPMKSQDKVKESIDNQQNVMIKQLQKNQLALTEGLDKNRLAITQGFDKMDEIKKWDLQQLPGYEAIEEEKESEATEEPEEFSDAEKVQKEDSVVYKISNKDLNKILGKDIYPDDDQSVYMTKKDIEKVFMKSPNKDKYKIKLEGNTKEAKVINKPITLTYKESDMNKNLMNKESIDLLKSLNLQLPAYYKDKSLEELREALDKSQSFSSVIKDKFKNVAEYKYDEEKKFRFAYPKSGEPRPKTIKLIADHNIMEIYNYNLDQLREFKEKTGTGILHFNNPLQLLDRLELLGGSILAGNNGVIQEFSQIAHLLNQMKVITKKQLNDLLKKYILNK